MPLSKFRWVCFCFFRKRSNPMLDQLFADQQNKKRPQQKRGSSAEYCRSVGSLCMCTQCTHVIRFSLYMYICTVLLCILILLLLYRYYRRVWFYLQVICYTSLTVTQKGTHINSFLPTCRRQSAPSETHWRTRLNLRPTSPPKHCCRSLPQTCNYLSRCNQNPLQTDWSHISGTGRGQDCLDRLHKYHGSNWSGCAQVWWIESILPKLCPLWTSSCAMWWTLLSSCQEPPADGWWTVLALDLLSSGDAPWW